MPPDSPAASRPTADGVRPAQPSRRPRRTLPSRRQFLRATGAAAAGAAAVVGAMRWGLAPDAGPSGDRTSITYAVARPAPGDGSLAARTRSVPAAWYEQLQRAFDVQAALLSADLAPLVGSFAVPGSYDEPAASVAVDVTDESVRGSLEELAGDLAITVNVVDEIPPDDDAPPLSAAHQVPDLDRLDVPSGYTCAANGSVATLAPALYDRRDGSRSFATSNHLYGAAGAKSTEHAGEPLYLLRGRDRRVVGRVDRGYPLADLVRVVPVDGYRPRSSITRASPGTVIGQYTRDGLADLMARGEPLTKVGSFSNVTRGAIEGVDGVTCYVGEICKRGQLRWGGEGTMVDGDSGSVSFHADPEHPDEYVLVAGINNARTWWPGMDFTWGTAAHHLLDEYGLHF